MSKPLRLAMWSGPRNLSTAMMRSWENRSDTRVMDEPLYAHYLSRTGLTDHPLQSEILAAQPQDEEGAIGTCFQPLEDGITIDYQKHMAQHLLPGMDREWLAQQTVILLLRDPRRVLASYSKVRASVTLADIGLPQQQELAEQATLIVDSGNFLRDPEAYSRAICNAVGVEFDPAMLSWPAGRRDSDGVWSPAWYASVEASTSFGSPTPNDGSLVQLPSSLEPVAEEAKGMYRDLLAQSLVLA